MLQKTATVLAIRDAYTGSVQPCPVGRVSEGAEPQAFLPLMLPENLLAARPVPDALCSMGNNIDRYLLSWN